MASRKPTLQELCHPGMPFIPWKDNSSPKPTSSTACPTLMELCYPDIHYVPRKVQHVPSDYHLECWYNPESSMDHSNTDSEFLWSNTDPTPTTLDYNNNYEQKITKIKEDITALLKIKHQDPANLETSFLALDEQLSQVEQMSRERNTTKNQTSEIQTPYQVNPVFYPSDSISDYLIQSKSEPTPFHLSQKSEE